MSDTELQWGVLFEDGEVELMQDTALFTTRTCQERAQDIAREQAATVVSRTVAYSEWQTGGDR